MAWSYLGPSIKHSSIWLGGNGKNAPEHPHPHHLPGHAEAGMTCADEDVPTCLPQDGDGTTWMLGRGWHERGRLAGLQKARNPTRRWRWPGCSWLQGFHAWADEIRPLWQLMAGHSPDNMAPPTGTVHVRQSAISWSGEAGRGAPRPWGPYQRQHRVACLYLLFSLCRPQVQLPLAPPAVVFLDNRRKTKIMENILLL